jgi:hypothetical protein
LIFDFTPVPLFLTFSMVLIINPRTIINISFSV